MPLENWLIPGEVIRFSAIDRHSKVKVEITNNRLIFYKEGLASETLEAYMLNHIAGYRITITRKITYLIAGIITAIIGFTLTLSLLTGFKAIKAIIPLPDPIIALIIILPLLIGVTGITLIAVGLTQYGNLELIITGKGKIIKTLKLTKGEYIKLSKHVTAMT